MNKFDLRDLVLSGVKWEIDDMPMSLSSIAKIALINKNDSINDKNILSSNNSYGSERTHTTSIVPPIAPQHVISVETALAMAARPVDVESLCRMIAEFNHPLRSGVTNVVLPHIANNPNGVVIVTDIPSGDDDISGCILSGASGDLLDKMLTAIELDRNCVSIVPLLFWRTPGGRTPTKEELNLSKPFFNKVIEFLKPRFILTLGTLAAMEVANISLPRDHGVTKILSSGITVIPIYHPNFLILKPAAKRDAWLALQGLQNLLKSVNK